MNSKLNLIRSLTVWMLLLGLVQQTNAQNAPTIRTLNKVKGSSREMQRTATKPVVSQPSILTVIRQGLQWLPLSHNENLKAQTLQSIAQVLNSLAGQKQPDQKEQIRDLFSQAIQATSGFERAEAKAEMLNRTAKLAIEVGDSALTHGLIRPIDQVASSIDDPVYRAYALSELARSTAFVGDQSSARHLLMESQRAVADTIKLALSRYRLIPLGQALDSLAQPGTPIRDSTWLAQAVQQLGTLDDMGVQRNGLTHLTNTLTKRSDKTQQRRAYDQLFRAVHTLPAEPFKGYLLKALAQAIVTMNDSAATHTRLVQLKQEAQELTNETTQRQLLIEIYMIALRERDPLYNKEELERLIRGGTRQSSSSPQGYNPFTALGELNSQSPASIRLRFVTQILGTMALVATQLGDQPMVNQLIQQTRQAANGIDNAAQLLGELIMTTAHTATQPTVQPVAPPLLRQVEQLTESIDNSTTQIRTWGKLAGWAAQAGNLDQAQALLKRGVQSALQLSVAHERGRSVGWLVQPIIQLADTSKARSLLAQVVRLVHEQPDGDDKANAYASILPLLPTRSRQLIQLPDAARTGDLLSQSLLTIRSTNSILAKHSLFTALVWVATDQHPAQAQSLLNQLRQVANTFTEPEKSRAFGEIIRALGTLARESMRAGDQEQAQTLFNQAQQLWLVITQAHEGGQAANTLVEKEAQILAVIRNPATFQRWLSQLQTTVKLVKPYAATWGVVVQVLLTQSRQEPAAQLDRPLFTQALTAIRQANLLSTNAVLLSGLMQAGAGVFSQDQLRTLLTQTLQAVGALDNSSKARELIALGRAIAQRRPVEQANELLEPILQGVQRFDNQGVKVYALNGLVRVDPRADQKAPSPLLWQRVLAMANTLDDGEAIAQTQNMLEQTHPLSNLFVPKGMTPSLSAQQQALQAANPSVRADVLSSVAESMAFWNEWSQANALLGQVKPEHKIQLIQGMLTGWSKHQPIKK